MLTKYTIGMFGLQNFRGSCWVNTCIQGVYRLPEAQLRYTEGKADGDVDTALQTIWTSKGVNGLPDLFKSVKKSYIPAGHNVGDSHELLIYLCDTLPWLDELCRFKTAESITCDHCKKNSIREDTVVQLQLYPTERLQSITACIKSCVMPLSIPTWKCEACSELGCSKQMLMGTFPRVMIFQVVGNSVKSADKIIINGKTYVLSSILCHNGGHWWCIGRNMQEDSQWITFNDRSVGQCSLPITDTVRVLIYYRLGD